MLETTVVDAVIVKFKSVNCVAWDLTLSVVSFYHCRHVNCSEIDTSHMYFVLLVVCVFGFCKLL